MDDKPSNPNIEWKKPGFESQEKVTRKVDLAKAAEYTQKKDNLFQAQLPLPADLPNGLKKIRNKIRGAYDEDEDENDTQIVAAPMEDSSLLSALHDDEKKFLKQQETSDVIKQQLDIEKINTLNLAANMAKQAGFVGLKKETVQTALNENAIGGKKLNQTLQKEFATELKISKPKLKDLSDKELLEMMEGVHKVKALGGKDSLKALKKMDVEELVEVGKESKENNDKEDAKTARTICEKTGRTECKTTKKEDKEQAQLAMVKKQNANKAFAKER